MRIGAVILTYHDAELVQRAADSVAADVDRVYVLDNGSPETYLAPLRRFCAERGHVLIENGQNIGYARANNIGIRRALDDGCDAMLVMNNDAFARPGAVEKLAGHLAEHPDVAAVGPMVLGVPSGEVMHTASALDLESGHSEWLDMLRPLEEIDRRTRETGYLSGEAFLIGAEAIRACGAFDERFRHYFEDTELSARLRRAGWRLDVVPDAVFDHVVGATMPGMFGAFYRAHSRPLFLHWGLGQPWHEAASRSLRPALRSGFEFAVRGRVWRALRGSLWGWITGVRRARRAEPPRVPLVDPAERNPAWSDPRP